MSNLTMWVLAASADRWAGEWPLLAAASLARGAKPDLVVLQGVDVGVPRSRDVDQPRAFARLAGMGHITFAATDLRATGHIGQALVSPRALVGAAPRRLEVDEGRPQQVGASGILAHDPDSPELTVTALGLAGHDGMQQLQPARTEVMLADSPAVPLAALVIPWPGGLALTGPGVRVHSAGVVSSAPLPLLQLVLSTT